MYTPAPQSAIQQPGLQPEQQQQLPEVQAKPKAPAKSKSGDVGAFIQQLISLAAYVKELETQAHLIHLNLECPAFLSIHEFLGDQYQAHLDQFDKIAEYIRSMDYLLPLCGCGLKDAGPPFPTVTSYDWKHMLGVYYKNLEELGMKTKKLEPIAAKIGAIDVQNYLAELCGAAFKSAWFIKSILRTA